MSVRPKISLVRQTCCVVGLSQMFTMLAGFIVGIAAKSRLDFLSTCLLDSPFVLLALAGFRWLYKLFCKVRAVLGDLPA